MSQGEREVTTMSSFIAVHFLRSPTISPIAWGQRGPAARRSGDVIVAAALRGGRRGGCSSVRRW
jgi:hypothetical protein